MDATHPFLLEALRSAAAHEGELRLYRSGKLAGFLPARTAAHAATAAEALRDGLIEVVRSESKGKTTTDWVRITTKGVDFVVQHDSPTRAMDELRDALQTTTGNLPGWIAQMRLELDALGKRFLGEVDQIGKRLDLLARRVEAALQRVDHQRQGTPIPWAQSALEYLAGRKGLTGQSRCPLPELFAALRQRQFELRIMDFHSGLRRMQADGSLCLLPCDGSDAPPEPEYALTAEGSVLYYVQANPAIRLAG
jgi:hypothetical protein